MKVIDAGTWTPYQKFVVAMVATALMLDGLDAQLLGLAIPALMRDWSLTRADLTPIAALSLVGMAIGATFGGWLGDRIGRRKGLILSVAVFGIATAKGKALRKLEREKQAPERGFLVMAHTPWGAGRRGTSAATHRISRRRARIQRTRENRRRSCQCRTAVRLCAASGRKLFHPPG